MAYDEALAERVRDLLPGKVTAKAMFGGLAFLISGHMAVVVSGKGGLMLRVDPAQSAKLVASTKAYPMVMRGKPMAGWLRVDAEHVGTTRALKPWVERATKFVATLPKKR